MEKNLIHGQNEGQEMESSNMLSKDTVASTNDRFRLWKLKSKRLVQPGNQLCTLAAKSTHSKVSTECTKNPTCEITSGLDGHILKHIVSIDERYLRRCLELIYHSASKAWIYNISSKTGILSGSQKSAKIICEDTLDLPQLDCQLLAGSGSILTRPTRCSIVGSIMRSKSMVNLLNSSLFRHYGAFDDKSNSRSNSSDTESSICHDLVSSPNNSSFYPSRKLEHETSTERIQKCRSKYLHERIVSTSSSTSSSTDQFSSTSSASYAVSQGMLQCTWKNGSPRFLFSVDDPNKVYFARYSKVETAKDNNLNCVYLIYLKNVGQIEHESYDSDVHLVGKVNVSSSLSLCPCNSNIRETEFVLFGGMDKSTGEAPSPSRLRRKYSGISKKVVDAFRASPSFKQKSVSCVIGKNAMIENSSLEPCQDSCSNPESRSVSKLLDDNIPANYELAAIVMRDHLPGKPQEKAGGWGLKFLRKGDKKQDADPLKPSETSQCGVQNFSDCSSSIDILIPAGIHGGPITSNGGPSSLTERWKSGGECICGGWDLGCPLTILTTRSSKEEVPPQANLHGDCKSFDIFIQDSKDCSSTLRMVNVRDGLYVIHFQSALSALQSLSIAVAYCHSKSISSQSKTCA